MFLHGGDGVYHVWTSLAFKTLVLLLLIWSDYGGMEIAQSSRKINVCKEYQRISGHGE